MSPSSVGISGVAPLPALPIVNNIDYGSCSSRENFLHTRSISQPASTVYTSTTASPTTSHPPPVMLSKFIQTEWTSNQINELEARASRDLENKDAKIDELQRVSNGWAEW